MPSDRSDDGYEMFTVRVNLEDPTDKPPGISPSRRSASGRLKIQVKHVNSGDEETRFVVDDALGWLRGKIGSLFYKRGSPIQPSDNSDPAQR